MWLDELEITLGALQAVSAEWHNNRSSNSSSTANRIEYLRLLQRIEALLLKSIAPAYLPELIRRNLAATLVKVGIAHSGGGVLSFGAQQTWINVLHLLLPAVKEKLSLSHLVPPLWDSVVKLNKDGSTATAALCGSMQMLQVLLVYYPCNIVMQRRQLPHLANTASVPVRVQAVTLLPWLVYNLKQGPHSSGEASLNADCFEYLSRGLECGVQAVQEASVSALRAMMEMGITIDRSLCAPLLDKLYLLCAKAPDGAAPLAHGSGVCIGYLLSLAQTNFTVSSILRLTEMRRDSAAPPTGLSWNFFGGVTPEESSAVVARLFKPAAALGRGQHCALAVAMGTVLSLCVWPAHMGAALTCVFSLPLAMAPDNRRYMATVMSEALVRYAREMPSNAPRVLLVARLREYLHSGIKNRTVLLALLYAIKDILIMLVACREVSQALSNDLSALALKEPGVVAVCSEAKAVLVSGSPHLLRRYLDRFVDLCHKLSARGSLEVDVEFSLLAKTLLAMPPHIGELRSPILTALAYLGSSDPPCVVVDRHYRQAELFFLLCTTMLKHHHQLLSSFTEEKLANSANMFLSLLVSNPSTDSLPYLRAASAACTLLGVKQASESELFLAVGLLEGQRMAAEAPPPTAAAAAPSGREAQLSSLRTKLYGDVYRVVRNTPWRGSDEGSLRWVISQALSTIEAMHGTPGHIIPATEGMALPGSPFLNRHRSHLPPSDNNGGASDACETAVAAVRLVAWGLRHYGRSNVRFCCGLLDRIGRLQERDSVPTAAELLECSPRTWNMLCLLHHILAEAAGDMEASLSLYAKEYAAHSAEWKTYIQPWLRSGHLDLRCLAARVLGCLLCLRGEVDAFTTQLLQTKNDVSDSLLALTEAHSACALYNSSPAATQPIAMSVIAEAVKRQALASSTSSSLLCCVRLAETCPSMLREGAIVMAMQQVLVTAERSDSMALVSPVITALLCIITTRILEGDGEDSSGGGGGTAAVRGHDKSGGAEDKETQVAAQTATIVLQRVLSPHQPSLLAEFAEDKEAATALVEMVAAALRASARGAQLYGGRQCISRLLRHFLSGSVFTPMWTPVSAKALGGFVPLLPEGAVCALAGLREAVHEEGHCIAPAQLGLLMDVTTSGNVRRRWLGVALAELLAVSDTARRVVFKEVLAVVLARSPDVSEALRETQTNLDSLNEFFSSHAARVVRDGGGGNDDGDDEGGRLDRRSPAAAAATGRAHSRRVARYYDVAAKVAVLELFASTIQRSDCADANVMNAVVTMTPLMEAMPELLDSASDILLSVLRFTATQPDGLMQWSTQLISNIKTAIQLSIFRPRNGCELALTLLTSRMCVDGNLRRVVKGLSLLLHTLERLRSEGYSFMAGGMGAVALTLATIAKEGHRWPLSATAARQCLTSAAGQFALTELCNSLTTAVAVSNGFEPPPDLLRLTSGDADNTAGPDVSAVLGALALLCDTPEQWMGPSLRHALGNLVCLVVGTDGADLSAVPAIVADLAAPHQEIVAEVAMRTLLDSNGLRYEEEMLLALALSKATVDLDPGDVRRVVQKLFTINAAQVFCYESPSVVVAAGVLGMALRAGCGTETIELVLSDLTVTYLSLEAEANGALAAAALDYLATHHDAHLRLLRGRCAALGLLLAEMAAKRAATTPAKGGATFVSPLARATLPEEVAEALLQLLEKCQDAVGLAGSLWCYDGAFPAVRTVLCVAYSQLPTGGAPSSDKSRELDGLCTFLLSSLAAPEDHAPTVEQLLWVVRFVTTLLDTDDAVEGLLRWLQPVGVLLAQKTAKEHGAQLKSAVRELGREKGIVLREFMENAVNQL